MLEGFDNLKKYTENVLNKLNSGDYDQSLETENQTDELTEKIKVIANTISTGLEANGFLHAVGPKERKQLFGTLRDLESGCTKRIQNVTKQTLPNESVKIKLSESINKLEEFDVSNSYKTTTSVLSDSFASRNIKTDSLSATRSFMIAKHIDSYVEGLIPKMIAKIEKEKGQLSSGERIKYQKDVVKKLEKVMHFFGAAETASGEESRGVRTISPIERVVVTLDQLERGEIAEAFENAVSNFVEKLIQRAFDQHFENPEQFVSHGFDHSLNVADYTKNIYENNPAIVKKMVEKYKFSEGEAKAALELLALLHDCGYPALGDKAKIVHGISGADIVETMREEMSQIFVSKEMDRGHFHGDFFHAVMFHSADKIEKSYGAKVETNLGSFLVEPNNVIKVLSALKDPKLNPVGLSRYATTIYVNDEKSKQEIRAMLGAAREYEEDHLSEMDQKKLPPLPDVKVVTGEFKGRKADLLAKKDNLIGIEFEETDVLNTPFSIIRLADNMDMRMNRLSSTQREEAFREFYHVLGDGPICQGFLELNAIVNEFSSTKDQKLVIAAMQKMQDLEVVLGDYLPPSNWGAKINQMKSPEEAVSMYKMRIIEGILAKPEHKSLSVNIKNEIRSIGAKLSDYDLRHFGGCEAIMDVQVVMLKGEQGNTEVPIVQIKVDKEKFDSLNKIRVNEKIQDEYGKMLQVEVGVGEYQIWRAADAFKSVRLGGSVVGLKIIDKKGNLIDSTFNSI